MIPANRDRFTAAGKPDIGLAAEGSITVPFGTAFTPKAVFAVDEERILVLGLRDGNGFIARFWM